MIMVSQHFLMQVTFRNKTANLALYIRIGCSLKTSLFVYISSASSLVIESTVKKIFHLHCTLFLERQYSAHARHAIIIGFLTIFLMLIR